MVGEMVGVFASCGVVVRMMFVIRQPAALKLGKPLLCILASSIAVRVGLSPETLKSSYPDLETPMSASATD